MSNLAVTLRKKIRKSKIRRKTSKKLTSQTKVKSTRCVCKLSNNANGEIPLVWNELRLKKIFCDGILHTTDKKSFFIHKAVLSVCSPYFMALFTNSLQKNNSEVHNMKISLDGETLEQIISYAYMGHCNITIDNVQHLLSVADQYNIVGIIQKCCHFLLKEMKPENCLGILRFAKHYFCHDLEKRSHQYVRHNFMKIMCESQEFEDLLPEEVHDLLSDDELNVRNEEVVFEAIIRWTDANVEDRMKHVFSLINCPRYGLMTPSYFINQVMNNKYIQQNNAVKDTLRPAELFLRKLEENKSSELDLSDPLARPRIPFEILFAVGGWSAGSPTNFVETYDTRADKWLLSSRTDLEARAYHGVCSMDNLIYVIGGFDGTKHFNSMRCYNPVTYEWVEKACMYHARCYVSVCTQEGHIYALGGFNGAERMRSAERYYPEENQWKMLPNMRKRRSDASAAGIYGKVYIVGGYSGLEVLSSGEVFNPETCQWTFISSMLNARSGVSVVAYNNYLYALGGFDGLTRLNSGEVLDVTEEQGNWREIREMFTPRSNFSAAILDDMIFVIGGFNGSKTVPYVECYDIMDNEWYSAESMNLSRSALGVCVISGLPNAEKYSYLGKIKEETKIK